MKKSGTPLQGKKIAGKPADRKPARWPYAVACAVCAALSAFAFHFYDTVAGAYDWSVRLAVATVVAGCLAVWPEIGAQSAQASRTVLRRGLGVSRQLLRLTNTPAGFTTISIVSFLVMVRRFWPVLDPRGTPLNPADETFYLTQAKNLASGHFTSWAWSPGIGAFLLPVYMLDRGRDWLSHLAIRGHLVESLFGWIALTMLSYVFRDRVNPITLFPLAAVYGIPVRLTVNSSDALFAAASTFALAGLVLFAKNQSWPSLAVLGVSLGVGAWFRNDFILVAPITVVLVALVARNRTRWRSVAILLACLTPSILAAALLIHRQHNRTWVAERSYMAFEQGQGVVYSDVYSDPYRYGTVLARARYGTPEQNKYSIIRAVERNPRAYRARFIHEIERFPAQVYSDYRGPLGLFFFVAVILGFVVIWRNNRQVGLILLIWPVHQISYFVTFFREGYLWIDSSETLVLAAAGFTAIASMAASAFGSKLQARKTNSVGTSPSQQSVGLSK